MKYIRDRRGRFDKDRRMYRYFFIVVGIYAFSLLGINTILGWFKDLEKVFEVENSLAESAITITWQDEVKSLLKDYGIDVDYATKLIQCESSWNPKAFHHNKGSIDRGLWQINSKHHPEISKDCAYDSACSTIEAIRIIKTKGFDEWICVSKGLIK